MTQGSDQLRDELKRVFRVSDMLTTCHSTLRDRYTRLSLALDITILAASACLVALAFADQQVVGHLTIFGSSPSTTIGIFSLITFILSLFQLRSDWKSRAVRFEYAAKAYADVKTELRTALLKNPPDEFECHRLLNDYRAVGETVEAVPENQFNRLKQKHLLKLRVSNVIDANPGTNIGIIRLRMWLGDTWNVIRDKKISRGANDE